MRVHQLKTLMKRRRLCSTLGRGYGCGWGALRRKRFRAVKGNRNALKAGEFASELTEGDKQ